MSYVSLRLFRRTKSLQSSQGLAPPPASSLAIFHDLRWHWRLYAEDELPWRDRFFFFFLRVVQRIAYNLGWRRGRAK